MWKNLCHSCCELRALIAGIGEQLQQKGIRTEQGRQKQDTTVAVLDVGRMHHGMQQQA